MAIHAQMTSHRKAPIHLTIFSSRARRLAGLASTLALAGAFIPVSVDAAATVDGQFAELGLRGAGVTTAVVVANRGGVPGDARAVTLNVTSTGSLAGGYATVYPCGMPRPDTSNLNFAPGQTVANAVTAKVGVDGAVCIYNDAPTHLIVDVNGYYPSSANFGALDPARLLDTRRSSIPGAGVTTAVVVANRGGVPGDARAVTLNVTSTGSLAGGYATVYPCGMPRPDTSNLNFAPGQTVANAVTAKVGVDGAVCIYNDAPTHLIVDVNGYYPSSANFGALDPARLLDTRRSSPAAAAEDAALVLINQLRASRGLGPVSADPAMSAFARNWSITMSQSGLRHSGGPYAENVGWYRGSSSPEVAALGLHDAFLASPPHLANMINAAWTTVGVGVHTDGVSWYITLEFR